MSEVVFRPSRGVSDAASLARVQLARKEVDGVLEGVAFEEYPSEQQLANGLEEAHPADWVIAEWNGVVVGYGHTMSDWAEHDGRHCYLHLGFVDPASRGMGIGSQLLQKLEARCRDKAARDGMTGRADFGANASGTELDSHALLLESGYRVLYTVLQMERPPDLPIEKSPVPEGYDLRPVEADQHRQIWQMIGDAYFDPSETGRGGEVGTEGGFRSYFEGTNADPSLWFVAWRGSRVAGAVLCRISGGVGTLYEVSIAHMHRRRGLARALLTRGVAEMMARHPDALRVITKKEFPTQAWRLYESAGYRTIKEFPRWRKELV